MGNNEKNTVQSKWLKMQKHSKYYHMFVRTSLFQMVSLCVILITINNIVWGDFTKEVFIAGAIKIICSYILGIVIGYFDWEYYKCLANKTYKNLKEIRKHFVYIHGVLSFGGIMAITQFDMFVEGKKTFVPYIMIAVYLILGYVWALFMWAIFGNQMKAYIQIKNEI